MKIIENLKKKFEGLDEEKEKLLIIAVIVPVIAIVHTLSKYFGCEMGMSWRCETSLLGRVGIAALICISVWIATFVLWNNPQWLRKGDGAKSGKEK